MHKASYLQWLGAGVAFVIAVQLLAPWATSANSPVGVAVPQCVAETLRGGDGDQESVCSWLKSAECKDVAGLSDASACPAQTFYYADSGGDEYAKNSDSDYCGTQREGNPGVYDCATVMTETAGCAK